MIKAAINRAIEEIAFWRHFLPAITKVVLGRWHVFRNTPTWVIKSIVDMGYPPEGVDPSMHELYNQAQAELELREKYGKD